MIVSREAFLAPAPRWYALTLLGMLGGNIMVRLLAGATATAWLVVAEFIFTLAMALRCYPLAPGGLIALEAVFLGLTRADRIYEEALNGFPVLLLLLFMVSAIYLMRELLMAIFSRLLLAVRSKTVLAFVFCLSAAMLSAFLDALTVLAIVISVALGLQAYLDEYAGNAAWDRAELVQFRAALRGLLMHAAIGTALGGVTTLVGEPQNLLIATASRWDFRQFFEHMAPVSLPVLGAGLATCIGLEKLRWFGFGVPIPPVLRTVLLEEQRRRASLTTRPDRKRLLAQGACCVLLVIALSAHLAAVGLLGLMVIVLLASLLGETSERALAEAFKGTVPFTALLVVFFAIVAVIQDQDLFRPIVGAVLAADPAHRPVWMFLANGALSAVSDNVFVATVYMRELEAAGRAQLLTATQMRELAVAINIGTNIPSIATPNGQAAFLFLLTSSIAPRIGLTYGRMAWMALPYFLVTTAVALGAIAMLAGGAG